MIRWFKGRKHKRKCYDSSDDSSTEYGFKESKSRDSSPYGFRKQDNKCVQVADVVPKESDEFINGDSLHSSGLHGSSSPHIYDEIKDLPEKIVAGQFRILTGLKFSSSHNEDDKEGPYMVVPVLPARRIPAKTSAIKCVLQNVSSKSQSEEVSLQNETQSYGAKDTDRAVRCERLSKTPTYESVDLLNCSKHDDADSLALPTKIENCDSNESESECDLNSSKESSESNYPVFLDKIEQNLFLKEQVREIIRSLSRADSEQSGCNRTDSFSTVSTESSAISSVPNSSCSEVSDRDVFADQSESEDDDEKHDCTNVEITSDRIEPSQKPNPSDNNSDLQKCVQRQKKRFSKCRRPKFKIYSISDEDHKNKLQSVIQEDTELYLLPSCNKETDYYNFKTCRKPVLIPTLPTRIYQDPNRLKNNKNNKLLGDLIRMNYDKQHLILV